MQKSLGEKVLTIKATVNHITNPNKLFIGCLINAHLVCEHKSLA